MRSRILVPTSLAMICFASNSLLCRLALKQTGIDAASFTFFRILSGTLALGFIVTIRKSRNPPNAFTSLHSVSVATGNWASAFALFLYAAAFSFAYNGLTAGTGALLLFGAVQATMIFWGVRNGERLRAIQIIGFIAAVAGLTALLLPGVSAPPLFSSILMLAAGVAWGIYSLRGKSAHDAIAASSGNFLRATPFAAAIFILMLARLDLDRAGIIYAIISGAITSGLGYVIWYSVLSDPECGLGPAAAATVQLSVPVLTATGGILVLHEPVTLRYLLASVAVLGGIALVLIEKSD